MNIFDLFNAKESSKTRTDNVYLSIGCLLYPNVCSIPCRSEDYCILRMMSSVQVVLKEFLLVSGIQQILNASPNKVQNLFFHARAIK